MIYTHIAAAIAAGALAFGGAWQVQDWRWTANTTKAQLARDDAARVAESIRQTDARQQRNFNDLAAGTHAAQLAAINNQLGTAREKIAALSNRQCLGADTVRMLNTIGQVPAHGLGLRTPASQPAGAPPATAGSAADDADNNNPAAGYASERDTATAIATCRASYAEVASQVNQILDIEDKRQAASNASRLPAAP